MISIKDKSYLGIVDYLEAFLILNLLRKQAIPKDNYTQNNKYDDIALN